MKRTHCLMAGLLCSVILQSGCSEPRQKSAAPEKDIRVEVFGDGKFPAFLAGTWKQPGEVPREFVFTPDGRLESVVIGMGAARMHPFETTTMTLVQNGEGVFVPGKGWHASYDPRTRELGVEITIDSFKMQVREGVIEGRMKEYFIGTVSADGKQWETTYITIPEYYTTTEELGKVTLMKGDEAVEDTVTFYKIPPAK